MLPSAGYATAPFGKWHLSNDMVPDLPLYEDARHAIAFVEKSSAPKKPFFINLWMHEPHTSFHTTPNTSDASAS